MVAFAEKIPDELLDSFEEMGFSSNRKVVIGTDYSNLQTEEIENEVKARNIFSLKRNV